MEANQQKPKIVSARWLKWLPVLSLLLGALVWWLYYTSQYNPDQGLNLIEGITAIDLGQVARSVAGGEGFVTRIIRPVSLRYHSAVLPHPELTHPPLYILILAAAIKFLGAQDGTLVSVSSLFFWLTVPVLWIFTRRLFDSVVAALVLLFYAIDPFLLQHSIDGGPAALSALLGLLFFCCLYRADTSAAASLAAGALAGMGYLTRYSYGLWIIPGGLFLFLGLREGRLRRILFFIAGAVIAVVPWLVRNWVVTGNPVFALQGWQLLMGTDPRPGTILWRSFSAVSLAVPRPIFFVLKKFLVGFRDQYLAVLLLTGNFASIFALTAILHPFADRRFNRLKNTFYLMILLEVVASSFFRPQENGLIALVPFALLVGGAFLVELLRKRREWFVRAGLLLFVLILCVIPITGFLGPRTSPRLRLFNLDNVATVSRSLPPDALLVSDVPWAVAWYGGLPCLWLPYRIEDYEDIRLYCRPPTYGFYLTRFYFGIYYSSPERTADWRKVYQTGWIPGGWGMKHKILLPDAQIFISREVLEAGK